MRTPPAPQQTYFLKILKNLLKIGKFKKSSFFGGFEGDSEISNPPNYFIYQYLYFLFDAQTCH